MIWKKLDDLLNIAGRIICFMILFICAYVLYDAYMVYRAAGDRGILAYKPDIDGTTTESEQIEGAIAWLMIDGTPIDYPVMQGIDNAEYINKDPYGNYSVSGSIFLDCRNKADFSDPYNLVYGHHMEYDYMFGVLDRFLDQEFLEKHQNGTLIVGNSIYDIEFFATVEAPAEESRIFAPTEAAFPLDYILKNAIVLTKKYKSMEVQDEGLESEMTGDGCHMLGLSTCKYPDTSDRTILFGFLEERQ